MPLTREISGTKYCQCSFASVIWSVYLKSGRSFQKVKLTVQEVLSSLSIRIEADWVDEEGETVGTSGK